MFRKRFHIIGGGFEVREGTPAPFAVLLGLCLAVTSIDLWPESSTQWSGPYPDRYIQPARTDIRKDVQDGITAPRFMLYGSIWPEKLPSHNLGTAWNWHAASYQDVLKRYFDIDTSTIRDDLPKDEQDAVRAFFGMDDGRRLFLSHSIELPGVVDFMRDVRDVATAELGHVAIDHYTGDELRLRVDVEEPLYLSFIDNWMPGWHATVDGAERDIELLFKTFKSVRINPDDRIVHYYYAP